MKIEVKPLTAQDYERYLILFEQVDEIHRLALPEYFKKSETIHRNQGIGKLLLDAAKDWAKSMNAQEIHLKVYDFNQEAIVFYTHHHFESFHRAYRLKI